VRQSQKKCVRRRSVNATERCVAAFEQVRFLPHQKECLMQKTTKKAAADYMTEPHDPRDSISSQASVRSPSSRATDQPPPPGRRKPVMESRNSPFSREFFLTVPCPSRAFGRRRRAGSHAQHVRVAQNAPAAAPECTNCRVANVTCCRPSCCYM